MVVSRRSMPELTLWFWWMLATALGIAMGSVILVLIVGATYSKFWVELHSGFFGLPITLLARTVVGSVIGAVLGVTQFLVLRLWIQQAKRWVLVSAGGMAIGNALTLLMRGVAYDIVYGRRFSYPIPYFDPWGTVAILAIEAAVAGTTVGIIQWFFLRRRTRRAGLWILASALAWSLAMILDQFGGRALFKADWIPGVGWQSLGGLFLDLEGWGALGLPIVGVVVGAITGLALVILLRGSDSEVANADDTFTATPSGSGY